MRYRVMPGLYYAPTEQVIYCSPREMLESQQKEVTLESARSTFEDVVRHKDTLQAELDLPICSVLLL